MARAGVDPSQWATHPSPKVRVGKVDTPWTPGLVLRLRALWLDGLSTAEIGRRLGISKNAVIAKAGRIDLPARGSPIYKHSAVDKKPTRAGRLAAATLPPLPSLTHEV